MQPCTEWKFVAFVAMHLVLGWYWREAGWGGAEKQKIHFPSHPLTLAMNHFCHVAVEAPASRARRELSVLRFLGFAAVRAPHS